MAPVTMHDRHWRIGLHGSALVRCAGINGVAVGAPVKPAGVVFEASQAAAAAADASSAQAPGAASAAAAGSGEAAGSGAGGAGAARRRSPDTGLPGAFCARG